MTPDNKVIVARQFRPGPERVMEDIPGGLVEPGEEPQAAMLRELAEETGYKAGSSKYLGMVYKDAYHNASWHYYLALDCEENGAGQQLDDAEKVEVVRIDIATFLKNAFEGRMTDVEAVLLAYEELQRLADD